MLILIAEIFLHNTVRDDDKKKYVKSLKNKRAESMWYYSRNDEASTI